VEHRWEPENMHNFPDPFFKVYGIRGRMQASSILRGGGVTIILAAS